MMVNKYFFISALVVCLGCWQIVESATFTAIQDEDPAHPQECQALDDSGTFFKVGSDYYSKTACVQYSCGLYSMVDNKTQLILDGYTCGVAWVSPPCYLVTDPSKPYPDCCPTGKCPDESP